MRITSFASNNSSCAKSIVVELAALAEVVIVAHFLTRSSSPCGFTVPVLYTYIFAKVVELPTIVYAPSSALFFKVKIFPLMLATLQWLRILPVPKVIY